MASEVDGPSQLLDRPNFKSSLEVFKRLVRSIIAQNKLNNSENGNTQEENINYSQFYNIVKRLFGHSLKTPDIKEFYRRITNHPDAPIDWTELFGCLQRDEDIIGTYLDPENTIFFLSKRETFKNATGAGKKKRDTIQCVVKVPLLDAVLTVSQHGTISLFNSKMRQYSCIHAAESSWFSGCDFLNQLNKVVAVTESSIVIWDYKCHGKNEDNYVCIKPMEHYLLCVCTVVSQGQYLQDDILIGDDAGFVSLYSISNDELKVEDLKSTKMSHPGVLDARRFRRFRRKLHHDWVVKIKYFPEINLFASSSPDSIHSLVLDHINRIKDDGSVNVFSVPEGVTTFAYCVKANIIATGGADKVIRLWHPNFMKKPMEKLVGHLYSIADISVNEKDQHIISLSTARGFRVWDIYTLSLLQVFSDTQQGPCDMRINSMIFDNKHLRLITGSCTLDVWPLTRMIQDTRQIPHTHDQSINVVVYNKVFHQVFSICSESILKVWEMETGLQIYEIKEAHGATIEVTSADIHINGFHFATGAYNGSLKIWDFGNGYEIKALHPNRRYKYEDQGFCQLSFLRCDDNQHAVIALDVSGNIKMIQGREDDPALFVTMEFNEDNGLWFKIFEPAHNKPMGGTKYLPAIKIPFCAKISGYNEQQDAGYQLLGQITKSHQRMITCFDALKMEDNLIIVTGSLNGEINMYSSTIQLGQNLEDDATTSITFSGKTKAQRINSVLLLLPVNVKNSNMTCINIQIPDVPKWKKDERNSEIPSAEHVEQPHGKDSHSLNDKFETSLIVSGHENGHLCLWNAKGELIRKELPYTKQSPISLTVLCTNKASNIIIAGNKEGYIIIWRFINCEDYHQLRSETLKQQLCWKAHTLKITSIYYEDSTSIVISASDDGSIRLWHASNGHYIGYFGQRRAYVLTDPKEFILPFDIHEMPAQSESEIIKKKNYELPLVFVNERFKSTRKFDPVLNKDLKYFEALSHPKCKRRPMDKEMHASREKESSALFKTIPIYKIHSVKFPLLPTYEEQHHETDEDPRITEEVTKDKKVTFPRSCDGINATENSRTRFPQTQDN
ncbi:WD repeat-containing protein 64 isoform X2 [Ranitomeya variabilis]|uniref:WD repeat-containing protein 64 isoform X2 n=1 Tax=Ranitomeya variabilis TaxID=490064 RepID=UPI0040561A06